MVLHHIVTGRIWVRILQVLHVVYLSFCFVSSSLQHVLLLWACIVLSQNTSDRVLCLCCLCHLALAAGTKLFSNIFGINNRGSPKQGSMA